MKNLPRGERWPSSKASGETPFKNSKSNLKNYIPRGTPNLCLSNGTTLSPI
jgi:hypothetical protein